MMGRMSALCALASSSQIGSSGSSLRETRHELGAFRGHLTRTFGAEPEAATGDNGDLVFELEIHRHAGPPFAISCAYLMER